MNNELIRNYSPITFSVDTCAAQPMPEHGSLSTPLTLYKTELNVICDLGYRPANECEAVSICMEGGIWSNKISNCTG